MSVMEPIMKLKDILTEGISQILYHDRGLNSAADILKNDRFTLSPLFRDPMEKEFISKNNKLFYMSFSRTKTGSFRETNFSNQTTFVIDGRKLGQRYHGKAIDFYGGNNIEQSEQEDRLYSEYQYIPNATKYILEVHVFLKLPTTNAKKLLKTVADVCERKGIPLFVYRNRRDFLVLRKERSQSYREFITETEPSSEIEDEVIFNENTSYDIRDLNTLIVGDPNNTVLTERMKNLLYDIDNSYDEAIFSEMEGYYDMRATKIGLLQNMAKFMRKNGITRGDTAKMLQVLREKWRKVYP